jgi:hypothetical protein
MHQPERHHTPVAGLVAVVDEKVNDKPDASSTNVPTAKWTIILPNYVERESTLKMIHIPAIQTPPGTTNEHATTAVFKDTSGPTVFTSNVPEINATKSTQPQHADHLLQQDITT